MNRKFFLALAYQRLADGRDEYGNQSVALSFDALTDEIEQEILDVWAWAEMAGLKAVAERQAALLAQWMQVGFIHEKLELLAFHTTFDPKTRTGQIPINTSIIDQADFKKTVAVMGEAFRAGLGVSDLVATASEGEKLGSVVVPKGKIGLATVCSIVVNGSLLKAGVPMDSRFGGILQMRNNEPLRFVELIYYSGCSLDPSEVFIMAGMTSVRQVFDSGEGRILANFREIPAPARAVAEEKIALLKQAGIDGACVLGNTSEPICQITVGLNSVGLVLLGGLNPLAAAVEAGIETENIGESGLIDFQKLQSFWQL